MYFYNFIKRSFLYQSLILYGVLHLIDAYKFYNSFYRQILFLIDDLGFSNNFEFINNKLYPNREIGYKIYNFTLIVIGGLCILNIPYFKFLRLFAGFIMILTAMIAYNPIYDFINLINQKSLVDYIHNLPKIEFMVMLVIGVGMICHYFKNEDEVEDIKEDIKEDINEVINEENINKENNIIRNKNQSRKNRRKIS